MKRITALLCALVLLPAVYAGASPAEDALPGGRTQYVMDVTLDTQACRLAETVAVTFENDSGVPWPEVCFSEFVPAVQEHAAPGAYAAAVTGVTGADGQALAHTSDREACCLTVALPQPLEPGEATTVTIAYEADVPWAEGERFQVCSFPGSDGVTYRLCQFYPMLCPWRDGAFVHHPYAFGGEAFFTECSDYALTLRLPEDFTVIASGREELVSAGDGQAVWQLTAEDMRDLVITATTEFAAPVTGQVDGVTVRSWGTPDQADQVSVSLQTALDSIALYEEKIGPCPFDELDICVAYMPVVAGGIEYPGLIEIIQAELITPEFLGITVTHEVAHQWFYSAVGNDQYDEPFLDESFASFCETLYRQFVLGERPEDIVASLYDRTWLDEGELYCIDLSYGDYYAAEDGSGEWYYYAAIYELGRTFLWEVRQAMGEEAFFAMLGSWYAQERGQVATIDGFVDHLTACSGGDSAIAALIGEYMSR